MPVFVVNGVRCLMLTFNLSLLRSDAIVAAAISAYRREANYCETLEYGGLDMS